MKTIHDLDEEWEREEYEARERERRPFFSKYVLGSLILWSVIGVIVYFILNLI